MGGRLLNVNKKQDIRKMISQITEGWEGEYSLKKNHGRISHIEMNKQYNVSPQDPATIDFMLQIGNLYSFVSFETTKDSIRMNISVKPEIKEQLDNIQVFKKQVKNLENKCFNHPL